MRFVEKPMKAEAKKILIRAFRALSEKERENLRWHLEQRTSILCGEQAYLFTSRDGGA